jgi:leader peptidase (prepilin peptidase) / N-methyltransferase
MLMKNGFDKSLTSRISLVVIFAVACLIGAFILNGIDIVFGAALAAISLWVAVVDLKRFEIPDLANLAILALGLLWSFQSAGIDQEIVLETAARSLSAAGLLLAVREFYRRLRHVEGLGLGDVKLAGAGASWLSWSHITLALLVATIAAIILVLVLRMLRGERIQAGTAIPFGAFLAPAIWVAWIAQTGGIYP